MTEVDPATVKAEWGTVYVVEHSGKMHLDPNCDYVTDEATKKDMAVYPEEFLDICSWCEQQFKNWREGLQPDDTADNCDRCGVETNYEYCEHCQSKIKRSRL